MARIFVSYRRQDIPYVAASLKERLERRFGEDSVFLDIDNIPFGVDFRKHIDSAVGQCHAMLVLIGDKWLARNESTGKNRLFDTRDYVRLEIEAALNREIPVVPVLVEDAEMPGQEELPESIQNLGYRNAAEVRAGRDFQPHMTRLVDGLWELLESKSVVVETPPASVVERPPVDVVETPPAKKARAKEEPRRPAEQTKKRQLATPAVAPASRELSSHEHPVLDIDRIRGKFGKTTGTYIAGTIPDTKLENARKTYAPDIPAGDVLMVYDDTVFGSAKDGFLLTTSGIYWRNSFENPDRLEFRELTTVDSKLAVVTSLVFVNGRKINFGGNQDAAAALAALLKEVLQVT